MNIKKVKCRFEFTEDIDHDTEYWLPDDMINNAFNTYSDRGDFERLAPEVYKMLTNSYERTGEMFEISTKEELINKGNIWLLVTRDEKMSAFVIRDMSNHTLIAASNGTPQGKKDLLSIMFRDVRQIKGGIYEVSSNAPEHILVREGATRVPVDKAPKILNKQVIPSGDGFHYRDIFEDKLEKIILENEWGWEVSEMFI